MRSLLLLILASCTPPASILEHGPAAEVEGSGAQDTADPSPVTGRILVTREEERYLLQGTDAHELTQDLNQRRPRDERFTGWTRWRLRWRFDPLMDAGQCHIGPVDVVLDLTTVLPAWEPPPDADATFVAAWDRYVRALEQHEAGHGVMAEQAAQRIQTALQAVPPQPSCAALRELAREQGDAQVDRLRHGNRIFDEVTGHGATQGAVFPSPTSTVLASRLTGS